MKKLQTAFAYAAAYPHYEHHVVRYVSCIYNIIFDDEKYDLRPHFRTYTWFYPDIPIEVF